MRICPVGEECCHAGEHDKADIPFSQYCQRAYHLDLQNNVKKTRHAFCSLSVASAMNMNLERNSRIYPLQISQLVRNYKQATLQILSRCCLPGAS